VAHISDPSAREAEAGGSQVGGHPELNNESLLIKTKQGAGGMAQVLQWLPSKHKALNSNQVPPKKKKKKINKRKKHANLLGASGSLL
jgi:hypothetical protein